MELSKKSDEEILAVANPIMDNLMDGSTMIDHEKHTRDFTDRMKKIVTKDYLEKVCSSYQAEWGYFARREFVAIFRRPSSVGQYVAYVYIRSCEYFTPHGRGITPERD